MRPWSRVDLYDVPVDEHTEDLGAVSADGAALEGKASVLTFHAAPGEVVALAREVGPDFYAAVVRPIVSSTVRRVLGACAPINCQSARSGAIVKRHAMRPC